MIGIVLLIFAVVLSIAVRDLLGLTSSRIGPMLIEFSVRRLPPSQREMRREEFLAEFQNCRDDGGPLSALVYALCAPFATALIRFQRRGEPDDQPAEPGVQVIHAPPLPFIQQSNLGMQGSLTAKHYARGHASFSSTGTLSVGGSVELDGHAG